MNDRTRRILAAQLARMEASLALYEEAGRWEDKDNSPDYVRKAVENLRKELASQ